MNRRTLLFRFFSFIGFKKHTVCPMPQLDTVTFLPQLFWLVCIYASFYLFLTKYILPPITKVLYARAHKTLQAHAHEEMSMDVTPLPILHVGEKMAQANQAISEWHTVQQGILPKHASFLSAYVREKALVFACTLFAQKYSIHYLAMVSCRVHTPNCSAKTNIFKKQFTRILFSGSNGSKKSDSLTHECREELVKFLCPELLPISEEAPVTQTTQTSLRQPQRQPSQEKQQTVSSPKSDAPKKPRAKAKPSSKKKN